MPTFIGLKVIYARDPVSCLLPDGRLILREQCPDGHWVHYQPICSLLTGFDLDWWIIWPADIWRLRNPEGPQAIFRGMLDHNETEPAVLLGLERDEHGLGGR